MVSDFVSPRMSRRPPKNLPKKTPGAKTPAGTGWNQSPKSDILTREAPVNSSQLDNMKDGSTTVLNVSS